MASENAVFLNQGESEPIKWHVFSPDVMALARRLDMPVFLFMGTGWSASARRLDRKLFTDTETAGFLSQNFVCARLDLDESPGWMSALLPVSRAQLGLNPTCQMFVIGPQGKYLAPVVLPGVMALPLPTAFQDQLIRLGRAFRNQEKEDLTPNDSYSGTPSPQAADLAAMTQPAAGFIEEADIARQAAADEGSGAEFLRPLTWSFESVVLGPSGAQTLMNPALFSPIVNWTDGGFFYASAGNSWFKPVYDQPAVINSQMALLLARMAVTTGSAYDRRLALDTIHGLLTQFRSLGLISAARIGDEQAHTFRSLRYSESPRHLRDIFPKLSDRQWVWNSLNLRVESNPLMIPYVGQPDVVTDEAAHLDRALEVMGRAAPASSFVQMQSADVNGQVAANLIQAAAVLGDASAGQSAEALFEQLNRFVQANDVLHTVGTDPAQPRNLVDYLAVADACLADFQSLGRIPSLRQARAILSRVQTLFPCTVIPGLPSASSDSQLHTLIVGSNCPQLADDAGESTTALYLRVTRLLSCIDQDSANAAASAQAVQYRTNALSIARTALPAALQLGSRAGGFFFERSLVLDGRFAVVVSSDPVPLAAKLKMEAPWFPVIPAIGSVWKSLQAKTPGIYVFANGTMTGPFSIEHAAAILRPQTSG